VRKRADLAPKARGSAVRPHAHEQNHPPWWRRAWRCCFWCSPRSPPTSQMANDRPCGGAWHAMWSRAISARQMPTRRPSRNRQTAEFQRIRPRNISSRPPRDDANMNLTRIEAGDIAAYAKVGVLEPGGKFTSASVSIGDLRCGHEATKCCGRAATLRQPRWCFDFNPTLRFLLGDEAGNMVALAIGPGNADIPSTC
jgi:hypothetical protein